MLQIRFEQEQDIKPIERLLHEAFADTPHAKNKQYLCITILRRIQALRLGLLAEFHGRVVAYIAAMPITINSHASAWVALYPFAVHPDNRHHGVGTQLLDAALEYLQTQAIDGCISIGAPDFYEAQGFYRSPLITVEAIPNSQFLIYQLKRAIPIGHVRLHTAFTSLAK